jgi:hypothetical protein
MPRSNENKNCTRVDESWEAIVCMRRPGQTRTRVARELMSVEKREFASDFSQLSYPGQTRTRIARELMRVEKREFAWRFSQLSCPSQTRTRIARELRSESLHESFLNSHAPVKREQELHESWWELRSESLHQIFLNSHGPVKREQELHESWWELRSESLHRVFSTLMPRSNENKNCTRVDESWLDKTAKTHQLSSKFESVQSSWESMTVGREFSRSFLGHFQGVTTKTMSMPIDYGCTFNYKPCTCLTALWTTRLLSSTQRKKTNIPFLFLWSVPETLFPFTLNGIWMNFNSPNLISFPKRSTLRGE